MADRLVDVRRLVAAVSTAWVESAAFLVPRCRRAMAAVRYGWVQSVAYLAAGYRRAVEVGRKVARTASHRAGRAGQGLGEWIGGMRRRSQDDLRGRMSQLVKQRSEIDRAEYVALTDLLEKDERDRQYQ